LTFHCNFQMISPFVPILRQLSPVCALPSHSHKVYFKNIFLPRAFEYYLPTYALAKQVLSFIVIFQSVFYVKIFRVLSFIFHFLQ
jgi:hypothetical protein